jgi:hypothetical protein
MAQQKGRRRRGEIGNARSRRTVNAIAGGARRKMRAAQKGKPAATSALPKFGSPQQSAGANRSEGIRLFKLAGRPSKEDFIAVYGPAGPRMTWEQRAAVGVPAEKFQAALAAAMRHAR